jgi:thymidylate synthase ThyX
MIKTKIILDSISEAGNRLTTFELTYPRFIHAEFMTHRSFSRNAASSRAIPIEKMIQKVEGNPAQIVWWGKNQSGMQAKEELEGEALLTVQELWHDAQGQAIKYASHLAEYGLHKQISNRLLEPFMNITVICTGTDWNNFFALRCHPDAQPEIQRLAFCMLRDYYNSTPQIVSFGEWHTPYLTDEEKSLDVETRIKVSVAKCARVSYLTHDGTRSYEKDLELYERLYSSGHMSPMEHVATPSPGGLGYSGNFKGWTQYRKRLANEVRTTIPTREEVEEYFNAKS